MIGHKDRQTDRAVEREGVRGISYPGPRGNGGAP